MANTAEQWLASGAEHKLKLKLRDASLDTQSGYTFTENSLNTATEASNCDGCGRDALRAAEPPTFHACQHTTSSHRAERAELIPQNGGQTTVPESAETKSRIPRAAVCAAAVTAVVGVNFGILGYCVMVLSGRAQHVPWWTGTAQGGGAAENWIVTASDPVDVYSGKDDSAKVLRRYRPGTFFYGLHEDCWIRITGKLNGVPGYVRQYSADGSLLVEAATPTPYQTLRKTYDRIYARDVWGYGSGPQSLASVTAGYRTLLQRFMAKHEVHSVVDAGCGDWQFSALMDWSGIRYLGVDVADRVIRRDRFLYVQPNIKFETGSITEQLPAADLLIAKGVLEHLSLADISAFLERNALSGRFKHVLITTSVARINADQASGSTYRGLNLTAHPFNLKGAKPLLVTEDGPFTTFLFEPADKARFTIQRS